MEAVDSKFFDVTMESIGEEFFTYVVNQQRYRIRWLDCSALLAMATPVQREQIEISPSGYGLHWPLLDEDLAVEALLQQSEAID